MRSKARGLVQRRLALPDGPRWSKPPASGAPWRTVLAYGAMAAVAVAITLALTLRDRLAWEHPAPWLVLRRPSAVALSAALGLALAAIAIAATRVVTVRFAWGRRLHRDLRPMARHLSLGHILLIAGFSSLGEELLFRGLLTPVIGVGMAAVLFGLVHQMAGSSRWVWVGWASVAGAGLGAVFAATGSLVGPLLAHAVMNAVNLAYLRDREPMATSDDDDAADRQVRSI